MPARHRAGVDEPAPRRDGSPRGSVLGVGRCGGGLGARNAGQAQPRGAAIRSTHSLASPSAGPTAARRTLRRARPQSSTGTLMVPGSTAAVFTYATPRDPAHPSESKWLRRSVVPIRSAVERATDRGEDDRQDAPPDRHAADTSVNGLVAPCAPRPRSQHSMTGSPHLHAPDPGCQRYRSRRTPTIADKLSGLSSADSPARCAFGRRRSQWPWRSECDRSPLILLTATRAHVPP